MPTKPNQNIVPNHDDQPQLLRILSHFSSLIDEQVNFGSRIFEWFFETERKGDHHFATLGLYRRFLELLDTLPPLIRASRIGPCKIILRSLFETMIFLEYMTQKDFENRGRDFILCLKYKEFQNLKRHLPMDPSYKEYLSIISKDNLLSAMPIPRIPELKKAIEAKNRLLNSKYYASSNESYQAIAKQRKGNPPQWWFSLHDGPKNMIQLAQLLMRPAQYALLYRDWAGYAHGVGGFEGQVEIVEKNKMEIIQLRLPENAEFVTSMAINFGLTVMKVMISNYANEKQPEFHKWYESEMREPFLKLGKQKIIIR